MKKVIILLLTITLFNACSSDKLEISEAKKAAENLIQELDKGNYNNLATYFTDNYNAAESSEKLIEKYKKLKDILGTVTSVLLTDSVLEEKTGEESKWVLTYVVQHTKINSQEIFSVVKEGDAYKVADHSVESKN
jgi:hypothetical protein